MFNLLWKILKSETGTLTFTPVKRFKPVNGIKRGVIDITLDADMPAGGWPVTAADFDLRKLYNVKVPSVNGYTGRFDQVNSKIVYHEGIADEVDTNELDTVVIRCEYVGS